MEHQYDQFETDIPSDLSDDELYFRYVIRDDHELLAVDMMLGNAFSPVDERF